MKYYIFISCIVGKFNLKVKIVGLVINMSFGLIGLKKDVDVSIREKFAITNKQKENIINNLLNKFKEAIVLSTCNRTEIYINYCDIDDDEIINIVFDIFNYDSELRKYIFFKKDDDVIRHIFEVSCGYHSKIKGEDQILGQVRESYEYSLKLKANTKELGRLFQSAISCAKKFKNKSKLYKIPVSSISIVVNKFVSMNCKNIMVLGYGKVGKLAIKYLLQFDFDNIYLVIRDKKQAESIKSNNVHIISYKDKNKYINSVDGIIGCTSAPHAVVVDGDIKEEGNNIYCFDMAVPRDIDEKILKLDRIKNYNIDEISMIDDNNKKLRIEKMNEYKWIIDEKINEYKEWLSLRQLSKDIQKIQSVGNEIFSERYKTYKNKHKNNQDELLVEKMMKSVSDYYVNRAIDLLKQEKLKGCEDECLKMINQIFKIKK